MKKQDQIYIPLIITLSIIIPLAVAALMFMPEDWHFKFGGADLRSLPFFHAIINGSTAVLLFTGFVLIKNKKINWHRICMLSAFVLSSIFLVSYVISKLSNPPVPFGGEGMVKYIYYFILISHILLSITVIPFVLVSYVRAITEDFERHRKIAKITFPIWLYVAVTGVIVYLMIAPYYN